MRNPAIVQRRALMIRRGVQHARLIFVAIPPKLHRPTAEALRVRRAADLGEEGHGGVLRVALDVFYKGVWVLWVGAGVGPGDLLAFPRDVAAEGGVGIEVGVLA